MNFSIDIGFFLNRFPLLHIFLYNVLWLLSLITLLHYICSLTPVIPQPIPSSLNLFHITPPPPIGIHSTLVPVNIQEFHASFKLKPHTLRKSKNQRKSEIYRFLRIFPVQHLCATCCLEKENMSPLKNERPVWSVRGPSSIWALVS